jgi:hypothetical protein
MGTSTHTAGDPVLLPPRETANTDVFWLATRAWPLFPIEAKGKRPLIVDWPNQATCEPEQIRGWGRRWPECNWAVATGCRSGFFVLDADGEPGMATIQELSRHHGFDWMNTLGVKTARGIHLYFLWPGSPIRNSTARLGPGLDVRGDGGYAIIPPSIHPSGTQYRWSGEDGDVPIATAPDWLLSRLRETAQSPLQVPVTVSGALIMEGQRNGTLTSLAGVMRRRGMTPQAIEAALLAENETQCKPPLPGAEVRAIAKSVSRYEPAGANAEPPEHEFSPVRRVWPESLRPEAFHGLAGDFVRLASPETEADEAALLFSHLVAIGSLIGRGAHYRVGGDRHYTNLFAVIVAPSSKGRKGTSWGEVRRLASLVDPDWSKHRCVGGLSSGEGLIWAVRDPMVERLALRKGSKITDRDEQVTDSGVEDKRLLAYEGELSQALQAIGRDGNTLSAVIRQAWDGTPLRVMTKNSKAACLEPHISIVGHVTAAELQRLLSSVNTANGFANRFLWICAARSKCLPFGGNVDSRALADLSTRTRGAIEFARTVDSVQFGPNALDEWAAVYPTLSEGRPGLLGAVTARAEAQTIRLAMLYALLDRSSAIRREHLRAALAAWQYCEDSARFIFGDTLGDPTADEILRLLRGAERGLTRTDIAEHFKRHKSSTEIGRALAVLQSLGLARSERHETSGRTAEVWFPGVRPEAVAASAYREKSEKSDKRAALGA